MELFKAFLLAESCSLLGGAPHTAPSPVCENVTLERDWAEDGHFSLHGLQLLYHPCLLPKKSSCGRGGGRGRRSRGAGKGDPLWFRGCSSIGWPLARPAPLPLEKVESGRRHPGVAFFGAPSRLSYSHRHPGGRCPSWDVALDRGSAPYYISFLEKLRFLWGFGVDRGVPVWPRLLPLAQNQQCF